VGIRPPRPKLSVTSVGVILNQWRLIPPNLPANRTLSARLYGGLGRSPHWPVGPKAKPLVRVPGGEAFETDEVVNLGTLFAFRLKAAA